MPTSFEAAHGDGPPDRPAASTADIRDELRDHLESRRAELETAGMPPDAAEAEALRQFGDPDRVARELYWLQNGDRIMKQRLLWLAVVIIIAGLCAALVIQNRQYRAMLERQEALAHELAARTHEMLAAVKETVRTASARIRIVDDDGNPRPGVRIRVEGKNESAQLSGATYRADFISDASGWVDSGPLPLGTYYVYAFYSGRLSASPARSDLDVFRAGTEQTLELLQPILETRTYTIEAPVLPANISIRSSKWEMVDRAGSNVISTSQFQHGKPFTVTSTRNALLRVEVSLDDSENRVRPRGGVGERTWEPHEWPPDGAVIKLGTVERTKDFRYRLVEPGAAHSTSAPTDQGS